MKAKTAILQDYLSGEILFEKEAHMSIYPASMTKIMTSIIAFELLESGQITLDEKFTISEMIFYKLGKHQDLKDYQCIFSF